MGSLEEIYWNMAKKQWKVGTHYAIMPSCDGNYLINNTLYMSASSLCSHNMPSCSHCVYFLTQTYITYYQMIYTDSKNISSDYTIQI